VTTVTGLVCLVNAWATAGSLVLPRNNDATTIPNTASTAKTHNITAAAETRVDSRMVPTSHTVKYKPPANAKPPIAPISAHHNLDFRVEGYSRQPLPASHETHHRRVGRANRSGPSTREMGNRGGAPMG
jgi:hypothetical protein